MNKQHTPTPWTIVNAPTNAGFHARIYARGCVVCDVHIQPSGIDAQNAAHIVHCVNAYDELVAALQTIANAPTIGGISAGERKGLQRAAEVARAVLAKVQP